MTRVGSRSYSTRSPSSAYEVGADEEDVFGSDFESTDEEAAQGEGEVGERVVEEEDKKARRVCVLISPIFLNPLSFLIPPSGSSIAGGESHRGRPCETQSYV